MSAEVEHLIDKLTEWRIRELMAERVNERFLDGLRRLFRHVGLERIHISAEDFPPYDAMPDEIEERIIAVGRRSIEARDRERGRRPAGAGGEE